MAPIFFIHLAFPKISRNKQARTIAARNRGISLLITLFTIRDTPPSTWLR